MSAFRRGLFSSVLLIAFAAPAQALVDGEMAVSLTSQPGDPVRGRQIVRGTCRQGWS